MARTGGAAGLAIQRRVSVLPSPYKQQGRRLQLVVLEAQYPARRWAVAALVYASDRTSRCAPQDSGSGWIRCSFPVGLFHSRLHAGLSRRTACPTLTLTPAGGPRGALERPASDVIDLLLHGARERNDLHRRLDEILPRDLGIGEPRLGQRRHHALLDLGPAPALSEPRQLAEIDACHVHPSPG